MSKTLVQAVRPQPSSVRWLTAPLVSVLTIAAVVDAMTSGWTEWLATYAVH